MIAEKTAKILSANGVTSILEDPLEQNIVHKTKYTYVKDAKTKKENIPNDYVYIC